MSLLLLRGQISYLRSRGLVVDVISSPGEGVDALAEHDRVDLIPVRMHRNITPLRDIVACWRMFRVLRRLSPDIVHSHTPKAGLLGMMAATLARVPVRVYHLRGLLLETAHGPRRWLLRQVERVSCGLAHQVICNSHSLREAATEEGVCSPEKLKVLANGSGNGIDAERRFNPDTVDPGARSEVRGRHGIPDDALVVGFVGRIVKDKGVDDLVDAWMRLRDAYPRLHLLMVGPYESRDPVDAETRRVLESDPRIHLAGTVWETPPLYAAMDAFVLPTYREGFGNVLLEAAAMRLPVVTTRATGAIDAVAEGRTGLAVPIGDPHALSEAIRSYLEDETLRKTHGAAGRSRVLQDFRPELIWEALYQEYRRLYAEHGGRENG